MDKKITGFLVTEANAGGERRRYQGLRVGARLPGSLFAYKGQALAFGVTEQGSGRFQLSVRRSPSSGTRQLEIVAYDSAGRELVFAPSDADVPGYVVTEDGRARIDDRSDEPEQSYGDFIIREADATGLLTTLGTGQIRRHTQGNRVTTLMDRDAFAHAAAMMRFARQEVLMSQLFFAVPTVFDASPANETPNMIVEFDPAVQVDLDQPRAIRADDRRPERALLLSALRGVDVRILLHAFTVPLFIKIVAGVLMFPFAGTDGISLVLEIFGVDLTDTDEVKRYFAKAGATNVTVLAFEQPVLSAGVMHAKLMMMDRNRMLSIGSPFGQSYVDRQDHPIDAWIRGGATGFPKHDAGFAMTGPAHADFLETLRLFWDDAAGPADKLPAELKDPNLEPITPPPTEPSVLDQPEDGVCAVQIVRTLSTDQFAGSPKGEKGILEAYLRGFASARGLHLPRDAVLHQRRHRRRPRRRDDERAATEGHRPAQHRARRSDLSVQAAAVDHPHPRGRSARRRQVRSGSACSRAGPTIRRDRGRASCPCTSTPRSGSSTTRGPRSDRPTSTACRWTRRCRATSSTACSTATSSGPSRSTASSSTPRRPRRTSSTSCAASCGPSTSAS